MIKTLFSLSFTLFFFLTPLSSAETIRLTNGEWAPYLSKKLPNYGFASHVVKEAFASVNINVEYDFFPWKRSFKYAKEGMGLGNDIWHGTVVWLYTKERAKSFDYSDLVINDSGVLFYLKSNPVIWESLEDLQGKTIGATAHTSYPLFEDAAQKKIIKLYRAGNYDVLFKRLLAKRIDAVPQVRRVAEYYLRTSLSKDDQDKITFSPTVFDDRKYYLILNKVHKENKRFMKLFNEGLQNIKSNGIYDDLVDAFERGVYDKRLP